MPQPMTDATPEAQLQHMVIGLLRHYSFEADRSLRLLVTTWLGIYPPQWIVKAIIEALYQGRYKVVSVEQILQFWQRRGQPIPHFSYEFERIVCDRVLDPATLAESLALLSPSMAKNADDVTAGAMVAIATEIAPEAPPADSHMDQANPNNPHADDPHPERQESETHHPVECNGSANSHALDAHHLLSPSIQPLSVTAISSSDPAPTFSSPEREPNDQDPPRSSRNEKLLAFLNPNGPLENENRSGDEDQSGNEDQPGDENRSGDKDLAGDKNRSGDENRSGDKDLAEDEDLAGNNKSLGRDEHLENDGTAPARPNGTEPIHQFQPTNAAVPVPQKLKAIANPPAKSHSG
ncbi:MAG: hypothetical protein AB4042_05375 [Leptolyngbyaceae cyanobacterium]